MDSSAEICEWQVAWISDFQKWSELTLASSIWGTYWLSRLQQCQITSNKFLKGILGLIFQLWIILEKTLGWYDWIEIHLVGWLEAEGQSGLSRRRRQGGFPPLGPNDCVVIRRLVAVITDYWGGYSSCHTHAPTLSKAPCHSCHTAQCHMSSMWHVTRYQAPCLCRTIFCSGFACLLASHHGFRVATVYFLSLQNKTF